MKFNLFLDKSHEEEIIVYAHERTPLVEKLEELVIGEKLELIGYCNSEAFPLCLDEVYCFTVEDKKIFAILKDKKLLLKCRLYQIEKKLNDGFVKINQSCIINVSKIKRFRASISGSLMITLKNDYTDYVSRRQLKTVKERMGL